MTLLNSSFKYHLLLVTLLDIFIYPSVNFCTLNCPLFTHSLIHQSMMRHILLLTLFKQSAAIEFFSVLTATLILFPTFTKYHILTVFVFSFLVSLQIILYHRIVLLLFFLHIYFFFLILMHEVCERAKILFAILFFLSRLFISVYMSRASDSNCL